jgi:hypothetical protein
MSEQLQYNPNKKPADKHVFFAGSTLTSERARTAFHSAAQMRLDSGEDLMSKKFGKFAAKQWTALEKVDKFAAKNESQIRLTDFDAPTSIDDVKGRLSRSTFLPVEDKRFEDLLEKAQTADRDYWRSPEGERLAADVNLLSYQRIQKEYNLSSIEAAEDFFNDRMNDANEAINDLVSKKLPNQKRTMALLNETTLVSSPAKLAVYTMSPAHTTKRLQYEVLRSLTIAELAAGVKKKERATKSHVDEFNTLITDTVFDHGNKIGEGENTAVYAFYSEKTGEPLWISHLDGPLSQDKIDEYSKTAVLKESTLFARDANSTIGDVLTDPRTKNTGSTLTKMVREAEGRKKYTGDDFVESNGLSDLGGIMNIVMSAQTNEDERVKDLIELHRKLAEGHPQVENITSKDEKSGSTGQSDSHSFRRLLIHMKDGTYVEEIFVSLRNYLQNEHQYGNIDPKTGEVALNGPAHFLYEQTRWEPVARRLFPSEIYPPDKHKLNWDVALQSSVNRAIKEIKNDNPVPVEDLPQEHVVFQAS